MTTTRFAPSPTGYLHIGNLRAALFNYAIARQNGGTFVLRIDDTDQERSKDEYIQGIKDDLTWLGLTWDRVEHQSARMDMYLDAKQKLIDMGRVRPKREGEGFEIEWKKMNESIVKGLTGLMKATEKFKNWENDTRAAYETRLKQLTPPDALTIGSSHDPVRNAHVPTLASRAASFGDGHGGVCCTPSVLRARGTSPAPSTR